MNLLDLVEELKNDIREVVKKLRDEKSLGFDIPDVNIEIPSQSVHGELSTNISMTCSKLFEMSPLSVSKSIVSNLELNEYISKCEVAGLGFINFFFE